MATIVGTQKWLSQSAVSCVSPTFLSNQRQSTLMALFIVLCLATIQSLVYFGTERFTGATPITLEGDNGVTRLLSYRRWFIPEPVAPNKSCEVVKKVVFIKTHKTGSTTTASILERFGYVRNLSFAIPQKDHVFSNVHLFNTSMINNETLTRMRNGSGFDMLVNHALYNRKEMDAAVPNARYVSVLRDPTHQLESFFGYFEMGLRLKIKGPRPLETFMKNPTKYYTNKRSYMWYRQRNGQLYDFGFDHRHDENRTAIQAVIDTLSEEIDLMMIMEYYDESLLLLKKLMCWDYDDILYISNGVRSKSHRYDLPDDVVSKIRAWNAGDVMLYEHFNRTLWKRVRAYGADFQRDLAHFRMLEQRALEDCVHPNNTDTADRREEKVVLKKKTAFCMNLIRGDVQYTKLIRDLAIRQTNATL